MSEIKWAASEDDENWYCDSLDELIDQLRSDAEDLYVGREVYFGEVHRLDKRSFMPDVEQVLERIAEDAYYYAGDHADDYPDVGADAKDALQTALNAWAEKYLPYPTFYTIENIKSHELTAEDLA